MKIILVVLGGAIGALLRYLTMRFFIFTNIITFPYGTLAVNMMGSFAIGFITFFLVNHYYHNENIQIFLGVGLLGAFTTFSSFSLDTLHLCIQQRYIAAVTYVFLSVILSIIAASLGMLLSQKI